MLGHTSALLDTDEESMLQALLTCGTVAWVPRNHMADEVEGESICRWKHFLQISDNLFALGLNKSTW